MVLPPSPEPPSVDPVDALREHMKQMDLGQKGACETLIKELERLRESKTAVLESAPCTGCAEHAERNVAVRGKLEEALAIYGGGADQFRSVARQVLTTIAEAADLGLRESEKK